MDGQEDQDFSKLSIEDRVTHKNWKARVSGYEELARLFPTFEDKEFNRYSPLVKKFILDTNAAAQEKGLAAVLPYVDYCPTAGRQVEAIIAGLAAKCLNSTRSRTKELAHDIVLMCVEIEKQDAVLEELIKALDQKTPKNVAAVVRMITKCLNQFGPKVIAIKPIVPSLSKLLEDRDPTVRDDTKQLTIEIYRWVKDALLPQLASLKPILLDSLKAEFENVKTIKPIPQRLLRSQQNREIDSADGAAQSTANVEASGGDSAEIDEEIDPFELLEPVDIIAKLPNDFFTLIEAKKWQERKEALEKLQQLLEANPKLSSNADYGDVLKHAKRIVAKDANIVVATCAIKCLAMLAAGLRKGFERYAHSCVPVIIEKFKERKTNVVQALREAIDAVYLCTTLDTIHEDLVTALDNKNPSIRSETALFLARAMSKTNPALISKKLLKTLVTALLKTLGDPDPVVRESSAEALGTAAKAQGDRNMTPLLLDVEQLKMAKIDEYKAKVEVKKFASLPPPPPPSSSASAGGSSKPRPGAASGPGSKKTGARVVKPAAMISQASSHESLDLDLPPPPAAALPSKPKIPNKFGGIKSKLDTGSARSTDSSGPNSSAPKYGTVKRPGTVSSSRAGGAGTGGGKSTPGSASAGAASGAASSKKAAEDAAAAASSPAMNGNMRAKEQRAADEKALKVLRWNFTSPRDEFYAQLREQMTAAEWSSTLVANAFHSDFKFHIKAIDQIREFFTTTASGAGCVAANVDLILKWIALRFFDTNPSVIMKALELLLVIFKILDSAQYAMTDLEANSFFPYLIIKLGDPKDVVRNKVREILLQLRALYPVPKIFAHLFAGLQSKNARQRASCLEEIAALIDFRGMAIFAPPNSTQSMKEIAKFLSERDNAVRNGALACVVQVYAYEGEKVLKMVGNLSDKEMSLIEERIKRASKTMKNGHAEGPINGASGQLPSLGSAAPAGGGAGGFQRFSTYSRLPGKSNTEENSAGGGIPTKIGSVSNLSRMNLETGGASAAAQASTGSPYDTYSKSRIAGGLIGKRNLSGGLGAKAHTMVGFSRTASGNLMTAAQSGAMTPNRASIGGGSGYELDLDRASNASSSVLGPGGVCSEPSDNESIDLNGGSSGGATSDTFSSVSGIRRASAGIAPSSNYLSEGDRYRERLLALDRQQEDISARLRVALAPNEEVDRADSELIARIKSKHVADHVTGSPGRANAAAQARRLSAGSSSIPAYGISSPSSASNFGSRASASATPTGFGLANSKTPSSSGASSATPTNLSSAATTTTFNMEENGKFLLLFQNLSSMDPAAVIPALEHLGYALKNYRNYSIYLEPKVDQLVALINKQLRLFLTKYYPENLANAAAARNETDAQTMRQPDVYQLFRLLVSNLMKTIKLPLGRRISRDTLRELIIHLLPYFHEHREHTEIISYINVIFTDLIKGADTTNLVSALVRMLHAYVESTASASGDGSSPSGKTHENYKELTMKFIWKLIKHLNDQPVQLNADVVLLEAHLFFKSFPRNWWREKEDLPLRTIKTLVYHLVQCEGDALLSHFTLIENKDESELSYYVQKALRQCENQQHQQQSKLHSSTASRTSIANNSTQSSIGIGQVSTPKTISNSGSSNGNIINGTVTDENRGPGSGSIGENGSPSGSSTSSYPTMWPAKLRNPDFGGPLKTRQYAISTSNSSNNNNSAEPHATNNGFQSQSPAAQKQQRYSSSPQKITVPIPRSAADMRLYCAYLQRETGIEFDYDRIRAENLSGGAAAPGRSVTTLAESKAVVEQARERFEKLQLELSAAGLPISAAPHSTSSQ